MYFRIGVLPTFSSIVYSAPRIESWLYSSQKEFYQLHLKEDFVSIYHMTQEKRQSFQNSQNISSWTSAAVRCDSVTRLCYHLPPNYTIQASPYNLIFYSTSAHLFSSITADELLRSWAASFCTLLHNTLFLFGRAHTLITTLAKTCLPNLYTLL